MNLSFKYLCCRSFRKVYAAPVYWFVFLIPLSTYSETCSNDHLDKMIIHLRQPILCPPKQTPMQLLLYKTTTCITRPATTFFVSQMKKNLSKTTTTRLYPVKKWETNIRQQGIKINLSLIMFTLLLLCNIKFVSCLQKLDNL